MKFIIKRASLFGYETKPCDEAFKDKATYFSDCTAKTVKEARKEAWVRRGSPVQMDGFVRVFDKEPREVWVVEVKSLEDLTKFIKKYESVIISESSFVEIPYEIMIYDDYIE